MTTLTITPNWKNKSARFKGTIAAGEHVAVSIANDESYIADTTNLRLRVVDERGRTLAQFPMPPDKGETPDTWTSGTSELSCELNLNTVQMLAAVPPHATRQLLFVLDAYSEDTPEFTLYFKDCHEVTHWPRRRGEEEPVNLDDYADLIQDFRERIDAAEDSIRGAVDEANGIVVHADAAKTASEAARDVASQAAASAQTNAAAAKDANANAQGAAQSAAESASLATAVSIAKMRERTGSRLWHNVALSKNDRGQWVMDVEQDAGGDGGLFDAEVKALGTTEARSLASRFADVVNVKDFGAKGDGTTNDTTAINSAIAAAAEKSAVVYFPAGSYNVSGTLNTTQTVGFVGDGKLKRGSAYFSVANRSSTRNTVYVSVNGGGDGLSSDSTLTIGEAIDFVKSFGVLNGQWKIKLAAGTYTTATSASPNGVHYNDIHSSESSSFVIEGNSVDTSAGTDKGEWVWDTIFVPSSDSSYANIIYFGNCDNVILRDIEFQHDNDISNGTSVAFAYGCSNCSVVRCCIRGGNWSGIIFQNVTMGRVSNSLVDGLDGKDRGGDASDPGQMYGINWYNTLGNTNSGGTTRNTIRNTSVGAFSAGGRGYVHNDHNDFEDCGSAYAADFGAHIEDNDNTFVRCTNRCVYRAGAKGTTRTAFADSGTIVSCDSLVSNTTDSGALYWFGVNFHNLGTRGRKTLFHKSTLQPHSRLTINMGDVDMTGSELSQLSSNPLVVYNKSGSHNNIGLAGKLTSRIRFFDSNDIARGVLAMIVHEVRTGGGDATNRLLFTLVGAGSGGGDVGVFLSPESLYPNTNNAVLLGKSTLRWKNVWTENGSVEARLAALEAAVLALDPNFVNGRS